MAPGQSMDRSERRKMFLEGKGISLRSKIVQMGLPGYHSHL